MEVSNERSSESELQLRSVREQIYPKEGSREADFLFVDSEVVGEIDENRDADEDADISTRSATSGLMADYDVSVSYDVNKSEDATEMIDVEKEIAAAQTRNAKQFATFTESQLDLDHHQGSRSLQMKPEASVELSTLNNLSAPSHSFAQHSATLSNSSERNMARVEPQVQIRTRSIEQSAVVNKWISNSEGQFGGDNIAGDNGVGEKKTKSLQGIGSEPVNGVNHTAEEKVDLAAFKTLEAVAGELRQGLGLVFEQLNRIVDGDSSLAKQLDTHRSELAEVCRLAVGLRSDMSNLTQRQERLENELRDLKMELGVRYSTASEISLAGAQNSISRRRQGDGASAGCLDNVVGGGSQNSELNRAPSPKFNCASSRLSSIRNFKTQSKTSEIGNNYNMRTSAAAKTSSLKLSDDQLPYPSSSSVQSSNSELTDTIGRSNAGDPVEHFDELVKDRFVGHVATHTELYEMLHHLIGHYLKSSRKMESCIQKSEFSHFNSRQMFPSVLRAIKECNQQLWKSWNTCVESLQDRTVVRKTLGGESERNGSLSSLRDIFAENLQSALRLFIDNDLEKIYINGCRSYFEALPTCVTHLNLACQNSKTFANYIEDQVRCTQTKFAKHSIWDTSILRSQMEVLHWMLLMPYRLLKLDQSFLNTASNFLTKCTCTSHAHNNSDPIVAERDNSNTQPTRESEQQPSASTAQTVIISTSAFNDRQESDSSHANNDDPDLICSESALKFTAALRLIHEVSTSMAKCVKEAETVMVNCRDLQCDLSADLLGNGTFPKKKSRPDSASTYSREAGGVGSTESTLDSRMRHQRTDCSTPNVHRHTIDYSSVAVAENEQDHSVVRNCLSNQDNFRQNEPSNCVSTDDFYNSNYVSNGYHDQKRNGYNSLCSSGRSLSQTSLSIHSSSDHTLEGRDNEGIFDNGMGVLEVEDNLDDWDIPIVAPSFSPVDVKLAQNNRSKRTAIVARYDVAPDISQMPGPVQQRIQRTPKFYRPISMQSNASNKHLTSHEDLAPSYHSSNADQSFASSNDPTETVPQGLVQARSKAFEQIANSSFNLTDQPRNTHSSSNQHQYNSSFNRSQNLVGTQCATPGYVRGSKTVDSFQTGHYLYDDGRQLNGLYSTQKAPVNKSGFNINSNNFSNNIATTYDNRTRNKHVL
ncbi:uncharacterized protein LOC142351806 isoform X5 [Convolutriloba macropyga]|uniref:uncharacterized protein LOC142351806 isoform X5 n=1 Tax=Convolutriloba macropyga TaxID=536237 RepID=UPI003F51FC20